MLVSSFSFFCPSLIRPPLSNVFFFFCRLDVHAFLTAVLLHNFFFFLLDFFHRQRSQASASEKKNLVAKRETTGAPFFERPSEGGVQEANFQSQLFLSAQAPFFFSIHRLFFLFS